MFQDLVNNGAMVALANKFDETPLEKAKARLAKLLSGKIEVVKPIKWHDLRTVMMQISLGIYILYYYMY